MKENKELKIKFLLSVIDIILDYAIIENDQGLIDLIDKYKNAYSLKFKEEKK